MLPLSLALLFPWGPDARREESGDRDATVIARALAWSCLSSLVILTLAGIHNPRYAMPAAVFLPPLTAYVARGAAGAFVGRRPRIARAMLLGSPVSWPVVLLLGAAAYALILAPRLTAPSGRAAGEEMAAHLPGGAEVWADHLVEARPEVLHYARRAAGGGVRVRWVPQSAPPRFPPPGSFIVLRTDELSGEAEAFHEGGLLDRLHPVHQGAVHKYTFVLYRVE